MYHDNDDDVVFAKNEAFYPQVELRRNQTRELEVQPDFMSCAERTARQD